ncbi:hypothetical protein OG225_43005 (plasmid) [Nocardia sp. NBC_01377]|uniref:hypothetical protein n=1 Tax=Nocardia sp. NBC_01377 TaxID=2903595 RepID=UPI002F912A06
MSDISDQDAHAILEQMASLRAAHRRGDDDIDLTLHRVVERYGMAAVAEVMAARDDRERLGVEVELLRQFGSALYGRASGPDDSAEQP